MERTTSPVPSTGKSGWRNGALPRPFWTVAAEGRPAGLVGDHETAQRQAAPVLCIPRSMANAAYRKPGEVHTAPAAALRPSL